MSTPTTSELKDAFQRSGLWRLGFSFADALRIPPILRTLTCSAICRRRTTEKQRGRLPIQPSLV